MAVTPSSSPVSGNRLCRAWSPLYHTREKFKENDKLHSRARARCRPQKATRPVSVAHWVDKGQRIGALFGGVICRFGCVWIEFEGLIGVCEVLPRLGFDFPVGFDPVKKLVQSRMHLS